jgi:hypothetical protein
VAAAMAVLEGSRAGRAARVVSGQTKAEPGCLVVTFLILRNCVLQVSPALVALRMALSCCPLRWEAKVARRAMQLQTVDSVEA